MEVIGNLAMFAAAAFGILQRDSLDSSALGMAISFAMQVQYMHTSIQTLPSTAWTKACEGED